VIRKDPATEQETVPGAAAASIPDVQKLSLLKLPSLRDFLPLVADAASGFFMQTELLAGWSQARQQHARD
jgi:hypothetical protein